MSKTPTIPEAGAVLTYDLCIVALKHSEIVLGHVSGTCKAIYVALKTHIPVYSTSLDLGLGTRKPIEWQRLNSQVVVRLRNYLSTGKYYLLTIIKSQVYNP